MNIKIPNYAYLLAIFFGIFAFVIAAQGPVYITTPIIFLIAGGIFGYIWPVNSWKWGLWIAGPLFVFLGISIVFAGGIDIFLKQDLPILLLSISGACIGSYISAKYKIRNEQM